MPLIIEILEKLVSINTVSDNSNLPFIDFVRSYLEKNNIQSKIYYNREGDKANLLASVGPATGRGIILSAHTDVVPVKDQSWSSDPFKLSQREDRFYARGTADMKCFIAVALAYLPILSASPLLRPVHLALTFDEELGCLGVPLLIDEMKKQLDPGQTVIVGEPTNMKVADVHNGAQSFETVIQGLEAHSSKPHLGCSAIFVAAKLVNFLNSLAGDLKQDVSLCKELYPPFSSINVGSIEGGTASNIIPGKCRFSWGVRSIPESDESAVPSSFGKLASGLEREMKKIDEHCSIKTERLGRIPALNRQKNNNSRDLCLELLDDNSFIAIPFGTEGGYFQKAGYSTVICGPGSIEQAHKPNEFISLSQVIKCSEFFMRLVNKVLN